MKTEGQRRAIEIMNNNIKTHKYATIPVFEDMRQPAQTRVELEIGLLKRWNEKGEYNGTEELPVYKEASQVLNSLSLKA